jgi:type III secretion protein L
MNIGVGNDVIPASAFEELVQLDEAIALLEQERAALIGDARSRADDIVREAEAEAAQRLAAATRDCEAAVARGYEEGYANGMASWIERLVELSDTHARVQRHMHTRLARIVAAAVERIVCITERDALFGRALTTVQQLIGDTIQLRFAVHPDEVDYARSVFSEFSKASGVRGSTLSATVTGDSSLPHGSCVCESDFGTVDASLDVQLRAMRSALSRALRETAKASADSAEGMSANYDSDDNLSTNTHDKGRPALEGDCSPSEGYEEGAMPR